jgi:hypothetical protein
MWGAHNENTGEVEYFGRLHGDGRVTCRAVRGGHRDNINSTVISTTGSYTYTYSLDDVGNLDEASTDYVRSVRIQSGVVGAVDITVGMNDNLTVKEGVHISFILQVLDAGAEVSLTWLGSAASAGSGFLFSGNDDQVPLGVGVYKWDGMAVPLSTGIVYLMTRTDYI